MDFDFWSYILISVIVSAIGSFIKIGNESLASYLKSKITERINNSTIQEASDGTITDVKFPYEVPIGSFTNITATFHGTIKRGFFSCQIVDCLAKDSWSPALNTIKDLDAGRQTGILNFRKSHRKITWAIKPEGYLTRGKGRLIIGVFEERDIIKNGSISENHPPIALVEKEILLT